MVLGAALGLLARITLPHIIQWQALLCRGASASTEASTTKDSSLSARGAPLVGGHGPPGYIWEHIMNLGAMYCPKERPGGYICLAISENALAFPLFRDVLSGARPNDTRSTGYDNPRGGIRFRKAVADFLTEHVARRPVHMDAIASTSGATAVLHNLLYAIADEGDVCLIPSPYFTGFDSDLSDPRVGLIPFAVPCPSLTKIDLGISVEVLEEAFKAASKGGRKVKVLLLTSPHNPTGAFYSEEALRCAVTWAQGRDMQVVADEVYSNTLLEGAEENGFKSMLQLYSPLPAHVHVCWGFAKILGVAGWRVGLLISESNAPVMDAFCSLLHPLEASTDTLHRSYTLRE